MCIKPVLIYNILVFHCYTRLKLNIKSECKYSALWICTPIQTGSHRIAGCCADFRIISAISADAEQVLCSTIYAKFGYVDFVNPFFRQAVSYVMFFSRRNEPSSTKREYTSPFTYPFVEGTLLDALVGLQRSATSASIL